MADKHYSEVNTNTYFIFLCSFYAPMLRTGTGSAISLALYSIFLSFSWYGMAEWEVLTFLLLGVFLGDECGY
jgi:hypothetical protein